MRGLVAGLLISIPLLIVVVLFAGGGHGTYLPAKVLFPYTMLLAMTAAKTTTNPLIVLAIAQFSVYGLIIDRATRSGTAMKTAVGVAFLHLAALVGCFLLRDNSF
jgi:hypothetical protein